MSKQAKRQFFRRILAAVAVVALCVALPALPLDWNGLVRQAACLSAGIRQPYGAASMMEQSLFNQPAAPVDTTLTAPADPSHQWNGADTGLLDLPAAAPAVTLPEILLIDPPGNKKNGGKIVTRKMNTGNRAKNGIATVNRSGKKEDIPAALTAELTQTFENTDAPQVLILHTHTTEGYMTYDGGYYNDGDRDRTRDHRKSVVAVGEAIRLTLAAAGITAIHDTTIHDQPQYSGAYGRSADTAAAILEKYPTIKVVLDIHRDAILEDGAVVKPTATVAGKPAAQMMLITGTVDTKALPHPRWRENLALSTHLQAALDKVSPDLMRPLNTVASRYSQHLSSGWVLVEVGAEGNTVAEAVYSGQILARTLAQLLD